MPSYPPRSTPAAACPSPKSGHSRRALRASVPDSDRSDPAPSSTPPVTRPSEVYSVLFGSGSAGLGLCPGTSFSRPDPLLPPPGGETGIGSRSPRRRILEAGSRENSLRAGEFAANSAFPGENPNQKTFDFISLAANSLRGDAGNIFAPSRERAWNFSHRAGNLARAENARRLSGPQTGLPFCEADLEPVHNLHYLYVI